ncbi:site-specific integrase [Nocardia sp. NPDC058497]|uniref:site-specific integrase n=1 Tax=Nocardia sp. NPDC058497 TaxID=3346529 RepID=UPI003668C7CD
MDELRRALHEGRIKLPMVGCVERAASAAPYAVLIEGTEVPPISSYLSSLVVSDVSPLTVRSYAHDLLRWWKILAVLGVPWDRATREDVEAMVGWMRSAANPQRRRSAQSVSEPGSVNLKTGKPVLSAGYAPATINHALTVVYSFYEHHLLYGHGPLVNPVPASPDRQRGQQYPLDPRPRLRRAPMRQKQPQRAPRSIPDTAWVALFAAMTYDRDRALLEFAVSSGAPPRNTGRSPTRNGPSSKSTSTNARSNWGRAGAPTPRLAAMSTPASACPMLHVDPRMIHRLNDIETDLEQRRQRAHEEGWLGEIEGIDLTLAFLRRKRDEASRLVNRTTALGTPEFPNR